MNDRNVKLIKHIVSKAKVPLEFVLDLIEPFAYATSEKENMKELVKALRAVRGLLYW